MMARDYSGRTDPATFALIGQFHGRNSLLAGFCRRSIRPDRGADLNCLSRIRPAAGLHMPAR
jgi:hypothetical protein